MICTACGLKQSESDGIMCKNCRDTVDGGLDNTTSDADVFNCVDKQEGNFADRATEEAFKWLTRAGSMQVKMLEDAMRNYSEPVYDPANVGKHLARAFVSPMGGYDGDTSKVQMITLAVAT